MLQSALLYFPAATAVWPLILQWKRLLSNFICSGLHLQPYNFINIIAHKIAQKKNYSQQKYLHVFIFSSWTDEYISRELLLRLFHWHQSILVRWQSIMTKWSTSETNGTCFDGRCIFSNKRHDAAAIVDAAQKIL